MEAVQPNNRMLDPGSAECKAFKEDNFFDPAFE
jgi:hypothetical protein